MSEPRSDFGDFLEECQLRAGVIEALTRRSLGDGRVAHIEPLMFTTRICVSPEDSLCCDEAYCYHSMRDAVEALTNWDPAKEPEPRGWHRKPTHGLRRLPILCGECGEQVGLFEYERW